VVDRLAEHSAALVLLLAGTLAVLPSPGLPVGLVFGGVAVVVALSTLYRPGPIRLPRRLARRPFPPALLQVLARRGVPLLRRLERSSRPRLEPATRGLGATFGYLMIAVQAALVALPIPFGNSVPGLAIVCLALGLARRDGALVLAGHALGLAAFAVSASLVGAGLAAVRLVA
jgi:hypothetical protein